MCLFLPGDETEGIPRNETRGIQWKWAKGRSEYVGMRLHWNEDGRIPGNEARVVPGIEARGIQYTYCCLY